MFGGIFHFYSNFNRTFCRQTVENLIRRLIWFCTVYRCPIKRTPGLYGLTFCMLANFSFLCCRLLAFFSTLTFSKKYFGNTIRVSNGLVPNQDCSFVGPDLGPDCLHRSPADDKSPSLQGKSYMHILKKCLCYML